MTLWVVLVLALFFVQSTLAPIMQWRSNIPAALGPRDTPPAMPLIGARLDRAFRNMIEAMLVFIPLAILAEIQGGADTLAQAGGSRILLCATALYPSLRVGHTGRQVRHLDDWPCRAGDARDCDLTNPPSK